MKLAKENLIIAGIGIADLATTLLWVHFHGAREANPIFQQYLSYGYGWFALMKVILLVCPIFLLEWARARKPQFALRGSRFAIAAYLLMYMVGVAKLNPTLFHRRPSPVVASVPMFRPTILGKPAS